MFAYEDDDVRHCSLSTKKEQARRVDVSLTVFISGVIVLEVLVVTAGLDGSFGLLTFVSTTAIMAATATKTNPIIMTLNLRDILDQPCAPLTSGAGIGKAS
jgi:Kef-type K+ transport system membrane component KefB